ncbi:MAG TPA: hypothetical protein VN722_08365 [Hanamia sp.]|nr:hypothetical protein [Hanamia sp.]
MTRKGKINVEKAIQMLIHVKEKKGNGEDVEAGLNLAMMYVSNAKELKRKVNLSQQANK